MGRGQADLSGLCSELSELPYRQGEALRDISRAERLGYEPSIESLAARDGVSPEVTKDHFLALDARGLIVPVDKEAELTLASHWRPTSDGQKLVDDELARFALKTEP